MEINYGKGKTIYGTGVDIKLSADELATAIISYLTAHNVHVSGSRTVYVNNELCQNAYVYVDPSGCVVENNNRWNGNHNNTLIKSKFKKGDCVAVINNGFNASDITFKYPECSMRGVYNIEDWSNKVFVVEDNSHVVKFNENKIMPVSVLSYDGKIVGAVYEQALRLTENHMVWWKSINENVQTYLKQKYYPCADNLNNKKINNIYTNERTVTQT